MEKFYDEMTKNGNKMEKFYNELLCKKMYHRKKTTLNV